MIIKAIIDRFEEEKAILKTEDNKNIFWPKEKLAGNLKEGSSVIIVITDDKKDEESNKKLAKDILNEILNVEKNN